MCQKCDERKAILDSYIAMSDDDVNLHLQLAAAAIICKAEMAHNARGVTMSQHGSVVRSTNYDPDKGPQKDADIIVIVGYGSGAVIAHDSFTKMHASLEETARVGGMPTSAQVISPGGSITEVRKPRGDA